MVSSPWGRSESRGFIGLKKDSTESIGVNSVYEQ